MMFEHTASVPPPDREQAADANACIVGGLVGARWGVHAIPGHMLEKVTGCDTPAGSNPRPDELRPRIATELVRQLLGTSSRASTV